MAKRALVKLFELHWGIDQAGNKVPQTRHLATLEVSRGTVDETRAAARDAVFASTGRFPRSINHTADGGLCAIVEGRHL